MGLTPEGIAQNPIAYDLATDMFWRTEAPDLEAWVQDYALRRYGQLPSAVSEAWRILLRTVYNRRAPAPRSAVCRPPTLDARGPDYDNPGAIAQAWALLGSCARELGNADPYCYDLVDLTRQVLSNYADALHAEAVAAFRTADTAALAAIEARFGRLLLDLDEVLGTRREFLLGRWIAEARAWGGSHAERDLLEWNARNQVTLWGNRESMLRDYARKEWNGLMRGFYLPRWLAFFAELRGCLTAGDPFDAAAFHARRRAREEAWTHGREPYSEAPQGDAIEVACRLIITYRDLVPAADTPAGSGSPASTSEEVEGVWTTFATP
jgi:alpha-N-acetylglucosaminidase